ncbi:flagellar hook-associated protein 3, partial [mine drainage metagenome]
MANTQYNGQAIFAGTGTTGPAYDSSGNYLGGGNAPTRTVADGVSIPIGVTGPSIFGTGATGLLENSTGPPPTLGVLAQTVSDLRAGNLSAVEGTDLSNLENAIVPVENQAAVLGANYQRAQEFSQQAQDLQASIAQQLSAIQDVNLAQATTDLQMQQNTYQSALWAYSKSLVPTLAQY